MGWSCSKEAGDTLDAWTRACIASTGSQNVYIAFDDPKRTKYFFDTSRREHADGAITGSVLRMGTNICHKVGSFKIRGDGTVAKWPTAFKKLWEHEGAFNARKV